MAGRAFSDSVKLGAITENLKKNRGEIRCALCGAKLLSIKECHFDHIFPFAKGGKSNLENCQILCTACNLKKTDKELQDYLLEEQAKRFFAGKTGPIQAPETQSAPSDDMTKEEFDRRVRAFIAQKGDIHKVDFGRDYNHLPAWRYAAAYYGDWETFKKAFGAEDLSRGWSRETIRCALEAFIEKNGDVLQRDLKKENKLPSLPCILKYYPEYPSFTAFKREELRLPVRERWDTEKAIRAGKEYLKENERITENVLRAENRLPTAKVIYHLFGSISAYQQAVGSAVSVKNEFVTKEALRAAAERYFGGRKRMVDSMKTFFRGFPYSPSTVQERYGSFSAFCADNGITVLKSKKAKYSKQEVDEAVAKWIKAGGKIPRAKDLGKAGLPSAGAIRKHYEDWKEPFVFYLKLYEKLR